MSLSSTASNFRAELLQSARKDRSRENRTEYSYLCICTLCSKRNPPPMRLGGIPCPNPSLHIHLSFGRMNLADPLLDILPPPWPSQPAPPFPFFCSGEFLAQLILRALSKLPPAERGGGGERRGGTTTVWRVPPFLHSLFLFIPISIGNRVFTLGICSDAAMPTNSIKKGRKSFES